MRLIPEHKTCLEELYLHFAVPTDQLRRNPIVLGRIAAAFNRLTDRNDEPAELLRYMITRRKKADWPRLGDRARRFSPAMRELRDGEIGELVATYESIGIPLDEYLFRSGLSKRLENAFAIATGRIVKAATLVAALMAQRKRGLLPCLTEGAAAHADQAFADIDVVARGPRKTASG